MALSDEGEVFMDAESGDDAEQNVEIDDIKKNLLSDLSDDSPVKSSSGSDSMPPPPAPSADTTSSTDKMRVFLRIRPLKPEETATGENQVSVGLCIFCCEVGRKNFILKGKG